MRYPLLTANAVVPFVVVFSSGHAAAIVAAAVIHGALCYQLLSPGSSWLGPVTRKFRTNKPELWLTLDDGPDGQNSVELGRALEQRGAPATFFVIGERLVGCESEARELLALGHGLGNHTYSHRAWTFWMQSRARIRSEIARGDEMLRRVGAGDGSHWFRSPVGHKSIFLHPELTARRTRLIGWTHRALDGLRCDREAAIRRICGRVQPGDIILLHEGKRDQTGVVASNECILAVVDELQRRGFGFVIPREDQLL